MLLSSRDLDSFCSLCNVSVSSQRITNFKTFQMELKSNLLISLTHLFLARGGGGVLPYMGYIGMCGAKGYGFSAVLVLNRVSILAILVINRI